MLNELVVVLGLSVAALLICHRFGIPSIIGFILTGVVAGPYSLGLIRATEQVDALAKLGLVFLLFTIGMEFSPRRMMKMRREFFIGGGGQVLLTILGGALVALFLQRPGNEAVYLGLLLSLSSTAIVLKLLVDKAEMNTRFGKLSVLILIFQDIAIVAMMLVTPLLGGKLDFTWSSLSVALLKSAGVITTTLLLSLYVVPHVMDYVARTRSRELFLLTILIFCFGIAIGAAWAGLSLSLGAFLAGVALAESDYRHHALGNVLPFQDIFTSIFFISLGMLLDTGYLAEHFLLVTTATLAVLALKFCAVSCAALCAGLSLASAIRCGLVLAQVGEFAFVLAKEGAKVGIGTGDLHQLFLAVALFSMLASPLLYYLSERFAVGFPRFFADKQEDAQQKGHVVIVGYGFSGGRLAEALKLAQVPYRILDVNPDLVREARSLGEPISFGDGSHISVLQHVGAEAAALLVVLTRDARMERRIIESAKKIAPGLKVLVRTQKEEERTAHLQSGATSVVVDESESSKRVVTKVLEEMALAFVEIDRILNRIVSDEEGLVEIKSSYLFQHGYHIESYVVQEEDSLSGKTLSTSRLREEYGATLLLLLREGGEAVEIGPETLLLSGDTLILFGRDNIKALGVG